MSVKVLIVDDHNLFRSGIRQILDEKGFDIVGEAEDGETAVKLSTELKPDLILMDISMPNLSGAEATKMIYSRLPFCKIIALTMHESIEYVRLMIRAGAKGFLNKNTTKEELYIAINTVLKGDYYFDQPIVKYLLDDYIRLINQLSPSEQVDMSNLTNREREILSLIGDGCTSAEIAKSIKLNRKTVEAYRRGIMEKLNVKTFPELIKLSLSATNMRNEN